MNGSSCTITIALARGKTWRFGLLHYADHKPITYTFTVGATLSLTEALAGALRS